MTAVFEIKQQQQQQRHLIKIFYLLKCINFEHNYVSLHTYGIFKKKNTVFELKEYIKYYGVL